MSAVRVLVVDDHRSVLWGLRRLIESAAPALVLAGTAVSSAEALAFAVELRPDVVLLDLDLGHGSDTRLISRLRALCKARILVLTGTPDPSLQADAIFAGASGLVHKSEPAEVIVKAIACVHAGELWADRAIMSRVMVAVSGGAAPPGSAPGESLTPAELRVVQAVVRQKSAPNKVVANTLHISTNTLRNHLASIYGKLGLKCRLDLVLYALDRGLDRSSA